MYSALVTFMHNLSLVPILHEQLLNQGFMRLMKRMCVNGVSDVESIAAVGGHVLEPGATLLFRKDPKKAIIKQSTDKSGDITLLFTPREVDYISKTINYLSQSASCHQMIVEGGVMKVFKSLINGLSEDSRNDIASALANISATKPCTELLVSQGATELLIALSITSDSNTQSHCALALGY